MKFGNNQRTVFDNRCNKQAGCRTLDAGIVPSMTQDAALFIGADVPMHNGREGGDSKEGHHHQQAKSLPASALVHHSGIIPRWHPPIQCCYTRGGGFR